MFAYRRRVSRLPAEGPFFWGALVPLSSLSSFGSAFLTVRTVDHSTARRWKWSAQQKPRHSDCASGCAASHIALGPGCRRAAWPTERPVASHESVEQSTGPHRRRGLVVKMPALRKADLPCAGISVLGLKPSHAKPRAAVSENRMRSRTADAPLAAWRADAQ